MNEELVEQVLEESKEEGKLLMDYKVEVHFLRNVDISDLPLVKENPTEEQKAKNTELVQERLESMHESIKAITDRVVDELQANGFAITTYELGERLTCAGKVLARSMVEEAREMLEQRFGNVAIVVN